MSRPLDFLIRTLLVFYASLCTAVNAADDTGLPIGSPGRNGYAKGDPVPVSCLNRTMCEILLLSPVPCTADREFTETPENMYATQLSHITYLRTSDIEICRPKAP